MKKFNYLLILLISLLFFSCNLNNMKHENQEKNIIPNKQPNFYEHKLHDYYDEIVPMITNSEKEFTKKIKSLRYITNSSRINNIGSAGLTNGQLTSLIDSVTTFEEYVFKLINNLSPYFEKFSNEMDKVGDWTKNYYIEKLMFQSNYQLLNNIFNSTESGGHLKDVTIIKDAIKKASWTVLPKDRQKYLELTNKREEKYHNFFKTNAYKNAKIFYNKLNYSIKLK